MLRLLLLLLLFLTSCATLRPIAIDCAAERVGPLLHRGVAALESDGWRGAADALVAELGNTGICVIRRLAETMTGSRPQLGSSAVEGAVSVRRDEIGQRARQWLQLRRYEVPL